MAFRLGTGTGLVRVRIRGLYRNGPDGHRLSARLNPASSPCLASYPDKLYPGVQLRFKIVPSGPVHTLYRFRESFYWMRERVPEAWYGDLKLYGLEGHVFCLT